MPHLPWLRPLLRVTLPLCLLSLAACEGEEADDDATADDDTTATDDDTTGDDDTIADDDTTPLPDDDTTPPDDDTTPPPPETYVGTLDLERAGEASVGDGSLFSALRETFLTGLSQPLGFRSNSVLSEAFMGTVDALIITSQTAGDVEATTFEDSELFQIDQFIRAGHPVVIITDANGDVDASVLNAALLTPFGLTSTTSALGEAMGIASAPAAHPVTSEPNTISSVKLYDAGPYDPTGAAVLLTAMQGAPGFAGMVINPGSYGASPDSGPVLFFADMNTFWDEVNSLSLPGYASESADLIENIGEYLLANLP